MNFQSLYRGFGFVLPHYWVDLSPEGVVLSPEGDILNPGATTECRATFNHGPNEPARLARQWEELGALSVDFI